MTHVTRSTNRPAVLRHAASRGFAQASVAGAATWLLRHLTSPAVRGWTPGGGRRIRAGPLTVRALGEGCSATVLLHGITASGDAFGAGYDALGNGGRVIVPDVLGFGASLDLHRNDFRLPAHLDALDAMVTALDLDGVQLTVAGHSMGALLALHWAARRPEARRVVTFNAPLYRTTGDADRRIHAMGLLEGLFAVETPLARWTCAWMCEHRELAQWISVAISPQWPIPLSRLGVRHTWPAYLGGMNSIIRSPSWQDSLERLVGRGVPVCMVNGARDAVPIPGLVDQLAGDMPTIETRLHPHAGHDLPITYASWCARLLAAR
jgi:pimeloyl-ACP methyl ester carboxylesterase